MGFGLQTKSCSIGADIQGLRPHMGSISPMGHLLQSTSGFDTAPPKVICYNISTVAHPWALGYKQRVVLSGLIYRV